MAAGHYLFRGLAGICEKAGEIGKAADREVQRREALKEVKRKSSSSSSSLRINAKRRK